MHVLNILRMQIGSSPLHSPFWQVLELFPISLYPVLHEYIAVPVALLKFTVPLVMLGSGQTGLGI